MPLRLSKNRVLLDGIPLNEGAAANLASDTTINIWSVTGNVVPITGTATISAFSTAPQAGTKRTLLCVGTPTFTHSTNLLLPGAANYTATAGDRIEVLALTTTQFRLSLLQTSILSFATKSVFPTVGVDKALYLDKATGLLWRWDTGTGAYVGVGGGGTTITVGSLGRFASIQAAVDYIATLPVWAAVGSMSRDVLSWANNSDELVIDNTNTDLYSLNLPPNTWMKVSTDSYYYPVDQVSANTDKLTSAIRRVEATFSGTATVTFFTPIRYTIKLLEATHYEWVTFPADVHIKFISDIGSSVGAPYTYTTPYTSAWNRADAFKSGSLTIGNGVTAAQSAKNSLPFFSNSINSLTVNWGAASCIVLEFLQGSTLMNSGGADLMSPCVTLGSLRVLGATIINNSVSATSHFFHVKCGGDVRISFVHAKFSAFRKSSINIVDIRLFEKIQARRLIVDNLTIDWNDPYGNFKNLWLIGNTGYQGTGYTGVGTPIIEVTDVTINCLDANIAGITLIDEGIAAEGATHFATGKVMLADCVINAPRNTGTKKLYAALTGSTVNLYSQRCAGGTLDLPSAGTKTVDNAFAA